MKFFVQGNNGVILECDPIQINDGDTIRITIDDRWNLDQSVQAYSQVCKCFPKNRVIGLFSGMTLVKEIERDG